MHFKVKTVQFVQIEIDQLMPAQLNVPQSTKQLICINISSNFNMIHSIQNFITYQNINIT